MIDPYARNQLAASLGSPPLHLAIVAARAALLDIDCNLVGLAADHASFEAARSAIAAALATASTAVSALANPWA